MKKNLMMIVLGGTMLMPTGAMAQDDGGGYGEGSGSGNGDGPYHSPSYQPYAYITYAEVSNTAYVCILSDVNDVEISVCMDGDEVDTLAVSAEAGTQIPLYLAAYGTGELTIYVRRGTTLLAYYSTSI